MKRTVSPSRAVVAAALLAAGLGGLLALPGCSSFDDLKSRVQQRIDDTPAQVREVPGQPRDVYAAAKAILPEIGFHYVHGGPAQGRLEALSELSAENGLRSSGQRRLLATFEPGSEGMTRVALSIYEQHEDDSSRSPGFSTEVLVQDTPLYEVFYRHLAPQRQGPAKND